jgi:uncharacterized MAPEG superfamily protein
MTIPFWCLLIAVLIPYVLAFTAAYFKGKQFGAVDNNQPRVQGAALTGTGARVWAAQQNAWEALAVFTAAVLVAHFAGADPGRSAHAAEFFIVARHLHALGYAADNATFRALTFMVAFGASLWLFWLAATATAA